MRLEQGEQLIELRAWIFSGTVQAVTGTTEVI